MEDKNEEIKNFKSIQMYSINNEESFYADEESMPHSSKGKKYDLYILEYSLIEIHDVDEKYSLKNNNSQKFIKSSKTLSSLHDDTFLFSIVNKLNEYGNYFVNLSGLEKSTLIKYLILGNLILYISIFSLLLKYN
jgi:hypothetical protein